MATKNPLIESAFSHHETLDDWRHHGRSSDLAKLKVFIARGVRCQNKFVETGAAMQLVTTRWSPDNEPIFRELFQAYVKCGEIGLGTPMKVNTAGCLDWEHHGKHPLEVAVRVRNRPATLLLIELGALDFTDFRGIDPNDDGHIAFDNTGTDGHPGSAPAMAAFVSFCTKTWHGLEHVQAQIASAIMERHIGNLAARPVPTPTTPNEPITAPKPVAKRRRVLV